MHVSSYLTLLHEGCTSLASALLVVAEAHADEPDVYRLCQTFADQASEHATRLGPFVAKYGEHPRASGHPERLHGNLFQGPRSGGMGLLRDLHDVFLMVNECDIAWTMLQQAGQALRDEQLLQVIAECEQQTQLQLRWITTRMKQAAPQALVVG